MTPFGWKGAALAALGDRPDDFGVGVPSLTAREEDGVKLGDSTLSRFLSLSMLGFVCGVLLKRTDQLGFAYLKPWVEDVGMCNLHIRISGLRPNRIRCPYQACDIARILLHCDTARPLYCLLKVSGPQLPPLCHSLTLQFIRSWGRSRPCVQMPVRRACHSLSSRRLANIRLHCFF